MHFAPRLSMRIILWFTIAGSLQAADFPAPYNSERSTEPFVPAEQASRW